MVNVYNKPKCLRYSKRNISYILSHGDHAKKFWLHNPPGPPIKWISLIFLLWTKSWKFSSIFTLSVFFLVYLLMYNFLNLACHRPNNTIDEELRIDPPLSHLYKGPLVDASSPFSSQIKKGAQEPYIGPNFITKRNGV